MGCGTDRERENFSKHRKPQQQGAEMTPEKAKHVTEWLTRASLLTHGIALTAEMTYKDTAGVRLTPPDDGLALRLLANAGIGGVRLRGDARFRLSGSTHRFEAVEVMGEKNLDHRSHLRVTGEYDGIGRRGQLSVGYVRQFERFALRGEGTLATDGNVGAGASLTFSLGPDPADGGWRVSGRKLAQFGQAAVTVFRDEDGDGRRGPGEDLVEGVAVEAGTGVASGKTGPNGRTIIDGLRPHTPVMIAIDEGSVADPLLRPKEKGVVVVPRPGIAAAIELALSPTGEAEGTLLGVDGEVRGGVTLELIDGRGAVVRSIASEYDGYFLFDAVPYGDYRLRVSAANADLLGVSAELGIAVKIGRGSEVARLGQVRLPAGSRGRVAAVTD
jgi:hypothetical protein